MSNSIDTTLSLGVLPSISLTGSSDKKAKIHQAAQQFEALMVGELLKAARETSSEGWLGSGEGSGEDTAMSMAESQLSTALAKSGGLGLAKTIEHALTPQAAKAQNAAETENVRASSVRNR